MVTTFYERELGFGSIGLVETGPDLPFIQFPAVGVRNRGLDLVKNWVQVNQRAASRFIWAAWWQVNINSFF